MKKKILLKTEEKKLTGSVYASWKISNCLSKMVTYCALRAAAAVTAVRRETVVVLKTHRSELIQGRIHFQKRFISVCYAYISFSMYCCFCVATSEYKKREEFMLIIVKEEIWLHEYCYEYDADTPKTERVTSAKE